MRDDKDTPSDAADLRRMAEEKLKAQQSEEQPLSESDALRLVHELQVHQIELELQNEELQQARHDADAWLEHYADLFDFAPICYFTLDRRGVIRKVNLTGADLLGIERSNLVNKRFGSFVSPESRPAFDAFLDSMFEHDAKQSCEVVLQKQEHVPIYARLDGAVCGDGEEGRIAVVDITERRQFEEALKQSEEQFKTFFHSAAESMLIVSASGAILEVNDILLKRYGYRRSDFSKIAINHLDAPDVPTDLEGVLQKTEAAGYTIFERVHLKRDGTKVPVEVSCSLIEYRGQKALLAIIRDITERKLAEEALRESEARYNALFHSIADPVFIVDQQTNHIVDANEVATKVYGYSYEEIVSLKNTDLSTQPEETARATLTPESFSFIPIRYHKRKDGSVFPVEITASTCLVKGRTMIVASIRDITARKQAEETLTQAAERDRHIADILQQALIPPKIPIHTLGYEISARYQPALSESEVCGDFYDLIDLRDGKIGIVIGDIVGKGLPAAARVAAVRHTIRSYAFIDDRPSDVMKLVSDAIFRDVTTENDMLTAFFAVLDTQTGRMVYTNAGHESPILMHSNGSCEYLTIGGQMLDGLGKHIYSEGKLELQPNDLLVLVTDGITEARKAASLEFFGAQGIVQSLSKNAGASADQIAAGILEDATSFADGDLRDDVAIVVIKKLNGAST